LFSGLFVLAKKLDAAEQLSLGRRKAYNN